MSIQTIPLQSILPPQGNPRSAFDPATIEGLAASIRQDGLLQNLVVRPSRGRQFRIVSGERRYRALRLLQERGEIADDYGVTVEVRSKLSKDDALRLATIENVQRENLPPLDEAAGFAALIRKGASLATPRRGFRPRRSSGGLRSMRFARKSRPRLRRERSALRRLRP
jgi:ParB/RepB/Spo0J family partition protein